MLRFFLAFTAVLSTTAAQAQSYSAAPMLVYSRDAAGTKPSADDTVRDLGHETMGETVTKPGTPPTAPQALEPSAAPAEAKPAAASTPVAPTNPVDKLWPRNTIQIFLPSCTGLRPQYLVPCTCVITKLMVTMPHDEFLKKSEDGTLEQDPRLITIRQACIADALQKKE